MLTDLVHLLFEFTPALLAGGAGFAGTVAVSTGWVAYRYHQKEAWAWSFSVASFLTLLLYVTAIAQLRAEWKDAPACLVIGAACNAASNVAYIAVGRGLRGSRAFPGWLVALGFAQGLFELIVERWFDEAAWPWLPLGFMSAAAVAHLGWVLSTNLRLTRNARSLNWALRVGVGAFVVVQMARLQLLKWVFGPIDGTPKEFLVSGVILLALVGQFALVLAYAKVLMDRLPVVFSAPSPSGEPSDIAVAAAHMFSADEVRLAYLRPGAPPTELVIYNQHHVRTVVPIGREPLLAHVLERGVVEAHRDVSRRTYSRLALESLPSSLVVVPLKVADHIVGCLELRWPRRAAFGRSNVEQIESFAAHHAGSVRTRRGVEAVTVFDSEVSAILTQSQASWVEKRGPGTDVRPPTIDQLCQRMLPALRDILAPAGVRLAPEIGLRHREALGVPVSEDAMEFELKSVTVSMGWLTLTGQLPFPIGIVNALSGRICDAIVDTARDSGSWQLTQLQARLAEATTLNQVQDAVRDAAQALGMECERETATPDRDLELVAGPAVRLRVADTDTCLRFLISRAAFGPEFLPGLPWFDFFARLRDLISATWTRVLSQAEHSALWQEQALAGVAVVTSTVVHQMVNLTADLSSTLRLIDENRGVAGSGVSITKPTVVDALVAGRTTAAELQQLGGSLLRIAKLDETRPASLAASIQQGERLVRVALANHGIEVTSPEPESSWFADLPSFVLTMALANLIDNAKDALRGPGTISIEVSAEPGHWLIRVQDSGPGIQPTDVQRLFNLGFTTRTAGGGWGLYLSRRSLREHGGDLTLLRPGPGNTTFEIRVRRCAPAPLPNSEPT